MIMRRSIKTMLVVDCVVFSNLIEEQFALWKKLVKRVSSHIVQEMQSHESAKPLIYIRIANQLKLMRDENQLHTYINDMKHGVIEEINGFNSLITCLQGRPSCYNVIWLTNAPSPINVPIRQLQECNVRIHPISFHTTQPGEFQGYKILAEHTHGYHLHSIVPQEIDLLLIECIQLCCMLYAAPTDGIRLTLGRLTESVLLIPPPQLSHMFIDDTFTCKPYPSEIEVQSFMDIKEWRCQVYLSHHIVTCMKNIIPSVTAECLDALLYTKSVAVVKLISNAHHWFGCLRPSVDDTNTPILELSVLYNDAILDLKTSSYQKDPSHRVNLYKQLQDVNPSYTFLTTCLETIRFYCKELPQTKQSLLNHCKLMQTKEKLFFPGLIQHKVIPLLLELQNKR